MNRATQATETVSQRILVTGGAGFLGANLCARLLEADHEVICVDNFYSRRKSNVADLQVSSNFELIRHDVTFPLYVEVDEIYNLACPASPPFYQSDPVQTTKTNVHGAINMLGLAKRLNARILQASTSEVYGDPEQHPQREDYWGRVNPNGIRACYDRLRARFSDAHQLEHAMMQCLADVLRESHGSGAPPDERRYLACVHRLERRVL